MILILLIIKSCFVILIPNYDTTVFLGLKLNPIEENIIQQYEKEEDGMFPILYSDENQLLGNSLYRLIFTIPLIVYLLSILLILYIKAKQNRKNVL